MRYANIKKPLLALGNDLLYLLVSLPQEIQVLSSNFLLVLIHCHLSSLLIV